MTAERKLVIKDDKGFTLAELLIVVAIIAVLVAVSIPVFTRQLEKSREATDIANIRAAKAAAAAAYLLGEDGFGNKIEFPSNPWGGGGVDSALLVYDVDSGKVAIAEYYDDNFDGYYLKGTATKGGCEPYYLGDLPGVGTGNTDNYYTEDTVGEDIRAVMIYILEDGRMEVRLHDM